MCNNQYHRDRAVGRRYEGPGGGYGGGGYGGGYGGGGYGGGGYGGGYGGGGYGGGEYEYTEMCRGPRQGLLHNETMGYGMGGYNAHPRDQHYDPLMGATNYPSGPEQGAIHEGNRGYVAQHLPRPAMDHLQPSTRYTQGLPSHPTMGQQPRIPHAPAAQDPRLIGPATEPT